MCSKRQPSPSLGIATSIRTARPAQEEVYTRQRGSHLGVIGEGEGTEREIERGPSPLTKSRQSLPSRPLSTPSGHSSPIEVTLVEYR